MITLAHGFLFIGAQWIIVHGPNHQVIEVNIDTISALREPRATEGHFAKDVKCLLVMSNDRMITTVETCDEVSSLIKGSK